MATSVSSLELLRSYKSYQSIIASSDPQMAIPFLSAATVNCSSRSVSQRASCKLRSVLAKSGNVDKLEADDSASSSSSSSSSSLHKKVTGAVQERDFTSTPYVPVYVILPAGTINLDCELVDPDELINQLRMLKSINVDGVVVDCWWGIVEAHAPNQYNWSGYKKLFRIVQDLNLKLQVIMSFHEYGDNRGDDIHIPLPPWVIEIGSKNPDIFFTDREARRNSECLTWGIDNERVLRGRIALQVYYDYMRSFRVEFAEFLESGLISEIKIGLGPCGELRYPSYPAKHGWKYPGIGEFQCYDKYLTKSLEKAAEVRGNSSWGRVPENAGSYNSRPHETGFFCDKGDYKHSDYGVFFLEWYFEYLIDHARRVLKMANTAFIHTPLAAKLPCVHWSRDTDSLAAELIAGYDGGYTLIGSMLRESHKTAFNIQCADLQTLDQYDNSSKEVANADKLFREARHAAWGSGINFATENILACYDRQGYNRILDNAKPLNDPLGGYLSDFTYLRLSPDIIEEPNFIEFQRFVRRMHGESVLDLKSYH